MNIEDFLRRKTQQAPDKDVPQPVAARQRRRWAQHTGGATVLHKRKPLRDPKAAESMALIRARGPWSPGYRLGMSQLLAEANDQS